MLKLKLTIDREVTIEEFERVLTIITKDDKFELVQTTDQQKPQVTSVPLVQVKPVVTVPQPEPAKPQPPVQKPPQQPSTEPRKRPLTVAERLIPAIQSAGEAFPTCKDSMEILRDTLDWGAKRAMWRVYTVAELSDMMVLSPADITRVVTRIINLVGNMSGFKDGIIWLPPTLEETAKREQEEMDKVREFNRRQTGDPNLGFGMKQLSDLEEISPEKLEFELSKLDWNSSKSVRITNRDYLTWLGFPYSTINSRRVSEAFSKYHPEWDVARGKYVDRAGRTTYTYRYPLPLVMDPAHPFPGL